MSADLTAFTEFMDENRVDFIHAQDLKTAIEINYDILNEDVINL